MLFLLLKPHPAYAPEPIKLTPIKSSYNTTHKKLEREPQPVSRSSRRQVFTVTAYTAGPESTGKRPGDPAYGITASGKRVKEGRTLACPPELPFGTEVYIPYFDQTFVCEDRGGAIKGKRLDVYMESREQALKFGKRKLEVEIR